MNKDLKDKTLDQLKQLVEQLGHKPYLAEYIFTFIHAKGADSLSQITTLGKPFRDLLTEHGYYISNLKIADKLIDPDGTIKYLFELPDGGRIESVLLFDRKRRTLCVSTQYGCAMNCAFCATGKMKFQRNLNSAEITDQVIKVQKDQSKITNVVFMGMGEPLDNYDAMMKSVRILHHPKAENLGLRHITISTCGDVAGIEKLTDENIHPRLAVSLNAPTDQLRSRIMPINKKYPLRMLFRALQFYQIKTRQRITFEYILIKGINDSPSHAAGLAKRTKMLNCNINLIEYNPHPGCKMTAPTKEVITRFSEILNLNGIKNIIRESKGSKINAACGQLGTALLKK